MDANRLFISGILLVCLSDVAVCNNTTEKRLYDDLFTNYQKFLRPVKDEDYFSPVIVTVSFGINLVESLNEKEQKLTAHGSITFTWKDAFLGWNSSKYGNITNLVVPAESVWLPEIGPVNSALGAKELASDIEGTRIQISHKGYVEWKTLIQWQTICAVDVENFPYDKQICRIVYISTVYTSALVNFTVLPEVDLNEIMIQASLEWKLLGTKTGYNKSSTDDGEYLPIFHLEVNLKRIPTFFEMNLMLPALILSILMIPTFILPVESGEKVSLGVTVMLAYSVFLLMMSDVTPRTGNMPKLSMVIVMCTTFSVAAVFLNVMIINIHYHCPEKPVPHWLRVWLLQKLGRVLCGMVTVEETLVKPFTEADHDDDDVHKGLPVKNENENLSGVSKIIKHLEFFQSIRIAEEKLAENKEDWNKVGRVLDRLLLCFYMPFLISSFGVILTLKFSD